MSKSDLMSKTAAELVAIYNKLAPKPIASWKGPKEAIVDRIVQLQPKETKAKPEKKAKGEAKQGSGARIRELLAEGKLTPQEIAGKVLAEFGGKTTVKDVYWQRAAIKRGQY